MSRDDLHFRLRIPQSLKAKIEAAAADNRRSMTAEIVARLEASFEFDIAGHERQLDRLQETIAENDKLLSQFEKRLAALENARKTVNAGKAD